MTGEAFVPDARLAADTVFVADGPLSQLRLMDDTRFRWLVLVPRVPGYHVPFAERIRGEAGIATMAPGLITEAQQAEDYLQAGKTDLIALARELLWNPSWPAHAAKALGAADPLALLPKTYAWWLRRREDVRGLSK